MGGAGDIGGLLAIEDLRAGWQGVFHPSFDGNGNLMALHEASTGNMVAAYEYDPFGNPVRTSGVYAKENPIRFSGKYYDAETQLSYFGFRYYSASLGRWINRDLLEERGGWNLYKDMKRDADDPYAGASGVEGTSWQTEWEQAQDRLLSNTSLPHTTQSVTFDGKRNSGLPGAAERNQKTYSANATGHYPQGGAEGTGPKVPSMTVGDPAAGNADVNLYIYAANDPVNHLDALGLADIDFHKYYTTFIAKAAGFTGDLPNLIGQATQNTDIKTPAMKGLSPLQDNMRDYHFPSEKRVAELRATAFANPTDFEAGGNYFHALGDSFFHSAGKGDRDWNNYYGGEGGGFWGHFWEGHNPDFTFSDPEKALKAAKELYGEMCEYAKAYSKATGKPLGKMKTWDEIEGQVKKYIASKEYRTDGVPRNQTQRTVRDKVKKLDLDVEQNDLDNFIDDIHPEPLNGPRRRM